MHPEGGLQRSRRLWLVNVVLGICLIQKAVQVPFLQHHAGVAPESSTLRCQNSVKPSRHYNCISRENQRMGAASVRSPGGIRTSEQAAQAFLGAANQCRFLAGSLVSSFLTPPPGMADSATALLPLVLEAPLLEPAASSALGTMLTGMQAMPVTTCWRRREGQKT
jgi:hypothetical protein